MAAGREHPGEPPSSGSPLRGAIDAGEARDKVPGSDPATAPLGTDDEAAGTPVSARQSDAAIRQETGRGPDVPPQPANTTTGAGSRTLAYAAGGAVVLIVLILLAL